jgi:hypothetical protein
MKLKGIGETPISDHEHTASTEPKKLKLFY